jgi:hypothetical protein
MIWSLESPCHLLKAMYSFNSILDYLFALSTLMEVM